MSSFPATGMTRQRSWNRAKWLLAASLLVLLVGAAVRCSLAYRNSTRNGLFDPEFRAAMGGGAWGVSALGLGPNGDVLAEGRQDQVLVLWDMRTGQRSWRRVLPDSPTALSLAPDGGSIVVFFYEAGVAVYGRDPKTPIRWIAPCFYGSCGMSTDGRWLVISGEKVRERETGRLVAALPQGLDPATAVFSPDGKTLAIGGGGFPRARLQLWAASDWSLLADRGWPFGEGSAGMGEEVRAVAWAPDGSRLALGGASGAVFVSDPSASHLVRLGAHEREVNSLLFAPDGRLVSAGADGVLKVWEVSGGPCLKTLTGHDTPVMSMALSPDGSVLASGDMAGSVRLWDLPSGHFRRVLGPGAGDQDRSRQMEAALSSGGEGALVRFLQDVDPEVRTWAAQGLSNTRDVNAMKAVAAALRDPDPDVRLCAATALEQMARPWGNEGPFISDISPAVAPLTESLSDPQVSCQAALALGWAHDPRAVDALVKTLVSPSLMDRYAAARALGGSADRRAVPALMGMVTREDEDAEVREAAVRALGRLGDRQATGVLIHALRTSWANVQEAAAEALGQLGDPAAAEALCARLGDASERLGVRLAATRSLGAIGDRAAAPALLSALHDESAAMRGSAAGALGAIRATEAVEPLLSLLKTDADDDARQAAAEALGRIGDARAVESLIARLGKGPAATREATARAVAQVGDPRGIDALLLALKSRDWGTRMDIASALGGVDEPRVVTALLDLLLHDPEGNVRSAAATALARSKDPRVIPALTQALKDEAAQWSAEEALNQLQGRIDPNRPGRP